IKQGRAPHACFIACPDISKSYAIARSAAALFCAGSINTAVLENCPDFFEAESNPYKISSIREISDTLAKRAYSEQYGRAVIFKDADKMDERCQNALLKTLEEPPAKTLFLLTGNESGLLPTIRSRCAIVRTGSPLADDTETSLRALGALPSEAMLYTSLGEGISERAVKLFSDEDFKALRDNSISALISLLEGELPFNSVKSLTENKAAPDCVTFMLSFMRDMLLYKHGMDIACNTDKISTIASLCSRFTIGKINCIIEILTEAKSRLAINTPQALVLDRVFACISEEI
ncbi:MAG: hypothetical protein IJO48_00435, partial [Clostridia bacterium]|nr:hypothetical protein [Clostridia bacterium]